MTADAQELRARHRDRPLAKLTDDELSTLESLSESLGGLLRESEAHHLTTLGELAVREQGDRRWADA